MKYFLLLFIIIPSMAHATLVLPGITYGQPPTTGGTLTFCNGLLTIPESNPQGYFAITTDYAQTTQYFSPFFKNGATGASGGYQVTSGNSFHSVCACSWGSTINYYQLVYTTSAFATNASSLPGSPVYETGSSGPSGTGVHANFSGAIGATQFGCQPISYVFPSASFPGVQWAGTFTGSVTLFGKETTP